MTPMGLESRIRQAQAQGVTVHDPRQTYIGPDVDLARLYSGAVLHPGSRLEGPRTFLGPGAEVGTEGPATLKNAVLGASSTVASGYVSGAVLLEGAGVGASAHVRPGTLLEEQANTAHCVGLKHTILLSYATLGSLINFCDCLLAGGSSRRDHSEVGSGFIHFNYTPWGKSGDKATPSLFGDVPRGVFVRQRRIFLGGSGGVVGPGQVGFGAVTGAGGVTRDPVLDEHISIQPNRAINRANDPQHLGAVEPKATRNRVYIGNLLALHAWYAQVRIPRATQAAERVVLEAAVETITTCIAERRKRLKLFLDERGAPVLVSPTSPVLPVPALGPRGQESHLEWLQNLAADDVAAGTQWLQSIVASASGN